MNVWLTASWGVLLRSFHSRRWWSSQIPQMCHSLLSPRKQSDDLEKQRHVNNAACVKHSRWYHSHNTNSTASYPHATLTSVHFGRWKGKLHLFWCSSTSSIKKSSQLQTETVLVLCGWHTAKWVSVLGLTCARVDWLVVFLWEQGACLDLSRTVVQVHSGRRRNTRPIFTLHPESNQIRNTTIYQDANILQQTDMRAQIKI